MNDSAFNEYFDTVDFDRLTISVVPRSDAVGNIIRVDANKQVELPGDMKSRKDLMQLPTYPYIDQSVIFWVDYFAKGFHLYFGFDHTILGKRTKGHTNNSLSNNKSCRIMKKFDEQTCFMVICMALFIAFNESITFDTFKITSIKRFPYWRSISLHQSYFKILDSIKSEFTSSLSQVVVQSLDKIRQEFNVLHKYNISLDKVMEIWNETLVMDVMNK